MISGKEKPLRSRDLAAFFFTHRRDIENTNTRLTKLYA
jgi:hypothetical protein